MFNSIEGPHRKYPENFGCLPTSLYDKLCAAKPAEVNGVMLAHPKGHKYLITTVKNFVLAGDWKNDKVAVDFITQASEDLKKEKLDDQLQEKLQRILNAYEKAKRELQTVLAGQVSTAFPSPIAVKKQLNVRRIQNKEELQQLKQVLMRWKKEVQERAVLAETLRNLHLLEKMKAKILMNSEEVIKLFLKSMPKKCASNELCLTGKEVYVCEDSNRTIQAVAMCWNEGYQGYHLRYPITAPSNIAVLNTQKEVQRGGGTALVVKIAEDILEKNMKSAAPPVRLYCNPVPSSKPFYEKLGFRPPVKEKNTENDSSDSESDSDSDLDFDTDSDREVLEMRETGLKTLVEKQVSKSAKKAVCSVL